MVSPRVVDGALAAVDTDLVEQVANTIGGSNGGDVEYDMGGSPSG